MFSVGFAFGIEGSRSMMKGWSANERLYKLKYRMHNAHVIQTMSEDVMLVHRSADGWPSLCQYLDKDIPDLPYPHQNKNARLFDEDLMKSPLMSKIVKEMLFFWACFAILGAVAISWYFFM